MNYIKIRFGNDLEEINTEIQETVDTMFRLVNPVFARSQYSWKPQVDIYETPDEIVILVELAGVNKEDFNVEISRGVLKIYGTREGKQLTGNARYHLAEIPYGYFERNFSLSSPIDTETVVATYRDGFLHIRLAKLPLGKRRKTSI